MATPRMTRPRRMRRDRAQLEAALRHSRAELAESFDEFQRSLHDVVAPSHWAREHLGVCVALALVFGFALGRR